MPTGNASKSQLPATVKGQATRARIVRAAADLVFVKGINATSVDEVVAAAKVNKSQVYHYFPDKAALVRSVVDYQSDSVLTGQQAHLSRLDTWQGWQEWRDLVIGFQRKRKCRGGCPIGSMISELAESDELARLRIVDGFDRWEEAFRSGLAAMKAAGMLKPSADVEALALTTLVSIQGGLLVCQARRDLKPLENALDAAIATIKSHAANK